MNEKWKQREEAQENIENEISMSWAQVWKKQTKKKKFPKPQKWGQVVGIELTTLSIRV